MSEPKIQVAVTVGKTGTRIAQHAGKVRFFKIYDITGTRVTGTRLVEVDESQTLHNMLHAPVVDFTGHPLQDTEIILTAAIGPGAIQRLFGIGKRAYMIAEKNPDEAIEKLLRGQLQALDPRQHHHDHHHHDHHHHDHHHGHHHPDHPEQDEPADVN